MASELRDNLVKLYLQMPYKNSIQLSPALQKLQKQFNDNSLFKYTWAETQKNAVVFEKNKEETLIPKWKLNKSVVSKVKKYEFSKRDFLMSFTAGLYFIKNAPFNLADKIIRNGSVKHFRC